MLEVIWTGVPVFILMIVAVPSLKLLYYADAAQEVEMTVKITGNQWFWSYSYPDHGDIEFDSVLIPDDELKEGQPRLLSVDNPVVLPAQTAVRLLFTSADVIHDWAVPSLGLKLDAVPGRINESWVLIHSEGDYYGITSLGSSSTRKAIITACAPSCAASTMDSCRSTSSPYPRPNSPNGSKPPKEEFAASEDDGAFRLTDARARIR